jgi:type 1 fimbria pilin
VRTCKSTKKVIQITAAALLAGMQWGAQAQSADSGTINFSGQISASTCALNMNDSAGSELGGTKIVNLGTLSAASVGAGTVGSTFGTPQTVTFSVRSVDGTTDCTLASGNTAWDIALALGVEDIVTIGGTTYLRNSLTSGATNAAVVLRGGVGTVGSSPLVLRGGQGVNGTLMSGGTQPTATASQNIVLQAQFVRTQPSAAPTSGLYAATVPLLVVYR